MGRVRLVVLGVVVQVLLSVRRVGRDSGRAARRILHWEQAGLREPLEGQRGAGRERRDGRRRGRGRLLLAHHRRGLLLRVVVADVVVAVD